MKRLSKPTRSALARRKSGLHVSFQQPRLPQASELGQDGADVRRAIARMDRTAQLDAARREFLLTIERLAPHAMRDLWRVAFIARLYEPSDHAAVDVWSRRWGLNCDWARIAAANTLSLWRQWPAARGRKWDLNLTASGELLPSSRGRFPDRSPEWLVSRDHFDWLVLHHVAGVPYSKITSPADTARRASIALAKRIGL